LLIIYKITQIIRIVLVYTEQDNLLATVLNQQQDLQNI
jgi:hypothetical protein